MDFLIVRRKTILAFFVFVLAIVSVFISRNMLPNATPAFSQKNEEPRVIHMVTVEFETTLESGKELEVYRWDPGTIYVQKDEHVELKIFGVNGQEHPFYIEGTNIKGTVKKGAETTVPLHFTERVVYRLICTTHADYENNGPMIAYIVVD